MLQGSIVILIGKHLGAPEIPQGITKISTMPEMSKVITRIGRAGMTTRATSGRMHSVFLCVGKAVQQMISLSRRNAKPCLLASLILTSG
jgi:hypothetical protein